MSVHGRGNVARGELVKLPIVAEDDDCNINRAEDGELMGLLEEAALALQEGATEDQTKTFLKGQKHTLSGSDHP